MTPFAHAAHWYQAVLYIAPVALVVIALWISSRRQQREAGEGEQDEQRYEPMER